MVVVFCLLFTPNTEVGQKRAHEPLEKENTKGVGKKHAGKRSLPDNEHHQRHNTVDGRKEVGYRI